MKFSNEKRTNWLFVVGVIVGALAVTAGPAFAALTFSGTSITGDGAVTVDSPSTISIGTSTATGVTIGRSGQVVTLPGNLAISGQATTTSLSITQLAGASGCLSVLASGLVATSTCGGGGGGGSPGGSNEQVQFNQGGSFGGNSGLTYDYNNNSLTLGGGGNTFPLIINENANSSTQGAVAVTLTGSAPGLSQVETMPINVTYSGSSSVETLAGPYIIDTDAASSGTITHVLGNVSRMFSTGAGGVSTMAAYYGDNSVTGSGPVGTVATYIDFGRNIGAGTNVTNSVGLDLSNSGGAGTVVNDYGIIIPDYTNGSGKGTNTNVGLSIGGAATGLTAALAVTNGESSFAGPIVNNVSPAGNVNSSNISQQDIAGASTGVVTGFNSVLLTNLGSGQTNAGLTGAKFDVYNGANGTTTNLIAIEAQPNDGNTGSGEVTNMYGLKIDNAGGYGIVDNDYGVYVGNLHSSNGTYPNIPFSIYASDASSYNYFAGKTGIGTAAPATTLQVAGASSTIRIGSGSIGGCLELMDSSGNGVVNYITATGGVLSATTTKPSGCQ